MGPKKLWRHEILHALGIALGILMYAQRKNLSGIDLLRSASVFIEVKTEADTLGVTALSIDDRECKYFASACGSLAPAANESTVLQAIQSKSISKLFTSELSPADIEIYRKFPVPPDAALISGLAAKMYMDQLGSKQERFIDLVGKASRDNDGLIPLTVIGDYDRLSHCLKLAKASVARFHKESDPAVQHQLADEAARRRFDAKRTGYANAGPSERLRRDGMGIGKTLGFT